MNKEVPLKERIEKLYESGYVNEFNYLENQLQEARYLVTILHKQTEEKDKEIEKLNNTIIELEKCIEKKYYEAIKYIKENGLLNDNNFMETGINYLFQNILNILEGDEKE